MSRSVLIKGEEFKFSCAHFVSYQGFRERLHGHNYTVEVEVAGPMNDSDGYVIDFGILKRNLRKVCKSLNERILIPTRSSTLSFRYAASPSCARETDTRQFASCGTSDVSEEAAESGQVEITCQDGAFFSIPRSDCALLPIAFSTAEQLSAYLSSWLKEALKDDFRDRNISSITVRVFERPTQAASYRIEWC